MSKINIKPSGTVYRRVVETGERVFTLSVLKYPVSKDTFYYTARIFELKKCSEFLDQLEAETVIHEKSVFGRASRTLPSVVEMIRFVESWFASEFLQQDLDLPFDKD